MEQIQWRHTCLEHCQAMGKFRLSHFLIRGKNVEMTFISEPHRMSHGIRGNLGDIICHCANARLSGHAFQQKNDKRLATRRPFCVNVNKALVESSGEPPRQEKPYHVVLLMPHPWGCMFCIDIIDVLAPATCEVHAFNDLLQKSNRQAGWEVGVSKRNWWGPH